MTPSEQSHAAELASALTKADAELSGHFRVEGWLKWITPGVAVGAVMAWFWPGALLHVLRLALPLASLLGAATIWERRGMIRRAGDEVTRLWRIIRERGYPIGLHGEFSPTHDV